MNAVHYFYAPLSMLWVQSGPLAHNCSSIVAEGSSKIGSAPWRLVVNNAGTVRSHFAWTTRPLARAKDPR